MNSQISLVGMTVVCAIAIGAVAAGGAIAAPQESNTGFTCVAGKGTLDVHCDPGSSGTSGHVAVPINSPTQVTLGSIGSATLKTTIAGSEFILTATGAECVECMGENHEETVGGKTVMDVTGSEGHMRFTGVTTNVVNCIVKNKEVNTKELKFTTTAANSAKNVLIEPVVPTTIAVVDFEPGCPFGASITITGILRGTTKGATLSFATGAGELLVGKQVAEFRGEFPVTAGTTGSSIMNPASLTFA